MVECIDVIHIICLKILLCSFLIIFFPTAYSLGKGALAGASGMGMIALCYYGSGAKPGTLQEAQ